jgi:nucleotide-binding universal stress UspA family protein
MTQVLLVGTDCSECSHRAVDYAAKWARLANLHLYVVHVIQWSPFTFSTLQENEERHMRREAELERAHSQILDPVVTDLRSKGVDAEGVVRHGNPAETLSELANELDATNIIIGRKGQSLIKTKLFGSVASTLVQISDHPVTVVP